MTVFWRSEARLQVHDLQALSPSALATETALPLASPPSHLLDDPELQATLYAMRDYIRVETPFNVDRFEAMLYDHPNQPFVESVTNTSTGIRLVFMCSTYAASNGHIKALYCNSPLTQNKQ